MLFVILVVAVITPLLYAVIEIDHRINKDDPEVKW